MKTQFLVKLLLYYHRKNDNSGSAILAILIFLILLMLLMVILSHLSDINDKDKNALLMNIYQLNDLQQQYFTKHHQFSNTLEKLDIVKLPNTGYYKYSTIATEEAAYIYTIPKQKYIQANFLMRIKLQSYVSAVFLISPEGKSKEYKFQTIICEPRKYTSEIPHKPILNSDGFPTCGKNTKQVMLLVERMG